MKNSKNSSQGFSQYVDINLKYILTSILTNVDLDMRV